MNFIGIDLAWTYKNETGICIIDDSGCIIYLDSQVYSNEQIADIVLKHSVNGAITAVDAPLILKNEAGNRNAERELMSTKIHGINLPILPVNRNYFYKIFGSIRGEEIVQCILSQEPKYKITPEFKKEAHSLVEVFPTAICLGLMPEIAPVKYKAGSRSRTREEIRLDMMKLLNFLGDFAQAKFSIFNFNEYFNLDIMKLTTKEYKHLEDKLDSFLCALCAYYGYKHPEKLKIFGNGQDGFIVTAVCE